MGGVRRAAYGGGQRVGAVGGAQKDGQRQLAGGVCGGVGAYRHLTAAAQRLQKGALGGDGGPRLRVVDGRQPRQQRRIAGPRLHCQRPLAGRRDEILRRQELGGLAVQPQTQQPGGSQDGAVGLIPPGFAEAGFHIAAQGDDVHLRGIRGQLRGAAGAAGADARPLRQFVQRTAPAVDQHIAGIPAGQDGAQRQPVGKLRRHIFEAVHRQIEAALQQQLFQFADEDAETHAGQRRGLVGVAAGADGFDLNGEAGRPGLQGGDDFVIL